MKLFKRGSTDTTIETGSAVLSADNETLGYVKDVGAETFQVDVPLGRNYWLGINHVASATENEVVLDFTKRELGDYRLEEPSGIEKALETPIENEFVSQARGSIISDEEQMQARERMERELAEQSRRLHEN